MNIGQLLDLNTRNAVATKRDRMVKEEEHKQKKAKERAENRDRSNHYKSGIRQLGRG